MQRYSNNLQDRSGNAIAGAQVTVTRGGSTASLFSDNGTTAMPNPFYTDADGEFAFYAVSGTYDIQITGASLPAPIDFPSVILFDPDEIGLGVTEEQTATDGQTVVNISLFSYAPGTRTLKVFLNGLLQDLGDAYLETSSTSITFVEPLQAGWNIQLIGRIDVDTGLDPTIRAELASTSSGNGSAMVNFIQSGTGAAAESVQKVLRQRITVTQFGAVGDGTTDDTAAFIAAYTAHPGKTIHMPEPATGYRITGLLTVPAGTVFKGSKRQGTKLLHSYNGDFAVLGDGAGFEDCWIDGQGATYTGGCFVFSGTAGRQTRKGVRATDFDGPIESFGTDAGSQSNADDIRYERRNAGSGTGRYAVVIDPAPKLTAVPRKFSNYESGGTCSFSFGGSNNTYVSGAFLGDLEFNAESRAVILNGVRWANQVSATIDGHNVIITGDIAPQLTIANGADFINLMGATYNNSTPIIDNSDRANNFVVYGPVTYTPTLTSGGTAPSLGNGTLIGVCSRSGNVVTIQWRLTVGSTTTLGSGALRIGMPTFQPNKNATARNGVGSVLLNRGGTLYQAWHLINTTGNNYLELRATTGVVSATSPATFASGDTLEGTVTFQLN